MAARLPRLEPLQPTPQVRTLPGALKDPVRLAQLVGGVAMFFGSLLDWVEYWLPGHGWQTVSSFARAGDGAIALEIGLIVAAFAWADRVATSRQPVLVAAPLVLGGISLILLKLGWDQAQEYLASLANSGGYGHMLPGFWIALGGAILVTGAGAVRLFRARHAVSFAVSIPPGTGIRVLGGVLGAVAGIGAAVVLGETFVSNATVTGSIVTFLSIILGLVGAWLGARIAQAFTSSGSIRE
jgi:hypothetical protein